MPTFPDNLDRLAIEWKLLDETRFETVVRIVSRVAGLSTLAFTLLALGVVVL